MRPRRHALAVSTFPFLAVLLCAMGSLILMLLVLDRRAKIVARAKFEQSIAERRAEQDAAVRARDKELERRRQAVQEKLAAKKKALGEEIQSAQAKLGAKERERAVERMKMRELEARLAQLQEQLGQEQKGLGLRSLEKSATIAETRAALTEQERLTRQVLELEQALKQLVAYREQQSHTYSIVPFRGKNGENRRPIYIECRDNDVIFHPERVQVTAKVWDSDRFRKEVVESLEAKLKGTGETIKDKGYVLLLIRPRGIETYYMVVSALTPLKVEFGYEFIDQDWELDLSEGGAGAKKQPWTTAGSGQEPAKSVVGTNRSVPASASGQISVLPMPRGLPPNPVIANATGGKGESPMPGSGDGRVTGYRTMPPSPGPTAQSPATGAVANTGSGFGNPGIPGSRQTDVPGFPGSGLAGGAGKGGRPGSDAFSASGVGGAMGMSGLGGFPQPGLGNPGALPVGGPGTAGMGVPVAGSTPAPAGVSSGGSGLPAGDSAPNHGSTNIVGIGTPAIGSTRTPGIASSGENGTPTAGATPTQGIASSDTTGLQGAGSSSTPKTAGLPGFTAPPPAGGPMPQPAPPIGAPGQAVNSLIAGNGGPGSAIAAPGGGSQVGAPGQSVASQVAGGGAPGGAAAMSSGAGQSASGAQGMVGAATTGTSPDGRPTDLKPGDPGTLPVPVANAATPQNPAGPNMVGPALNNGSGVASQSAGTAAGAVSSSDSKEGQPVDGPVLIVPAPFGAATGAKKTTDQPTQKAEQEPAGGAIPEAEPTPTTNPRREGGLPPIRIAGGGGGEANEAGSQPGRTGMSDPLAPLMPRPKRQAPPVVLRSQSNRDLSITIECRADSIYLAPTRQDWQVDHARGTMKGTPGLSEAVTQWVERRQKSVQEGQYPYRPQIRFRVYPDGFRTYYRVYPELEKLGFPMSREIIYRETAAKPAAN